MAMKKITLLLILLSFPVWKTLSQTRLETCIQNIVTSFNKNDYDNAIVYLNEAISIDPTDYRLWGERGVCYKLKNEFAKALPDLNKSLELNPTDTITLRNRADVKFDLGDLKGAIVDYTSVIDKTNDGRCFYNRGNCYLSQHEFEVARKDFLKCAELYPKSAIVQYLIAQTYITNGSDAWLNTPLNNAYWAFKKAYELDSTLFEARLGMLQYKIRNKDYEGVDDALRTLGSDFPKRAEASYERGLASFKQKDNISAFYQLNKALIVNPQYADAYLLRAKVRMATGNYSAANDDLNNALSLDSLLWEAWLLRGKIKVQSYFGIHAIDDFTRSLGCPGPKAQAYRFRAMRKIASKDLVGAEEDYKAAVNDDFMNEEIRDELGSLYLLMQNIPMAYEVFHDVNANMEPNPESWSGEGQSLLLQNKNKDALVCFGKALVLDEKYRAAYVGIGRVQATMKKFNEALASFSKAIDLDNLKSDAYYERGCVYLSLKDKDNACRDFSTAELLGSTSATEKKAANCQ